MLHKLDPTSKLLGVVMKGPSLEPARGLLALSTNQEEDRTPGLVEVPARPVSLLPGSKKIHIHMFITKYSPCILPFIPNVEVVQCLGEPKGIRAVCKRHRRRTGEGRPQTRMQIFCQKLKMAL